MTRMTRPKSIRVQLYANDQKVGQEELSAENKWTHTFADLDESKWKHHHLRRWEGVSVQRAMKLVTRMVKWKCWH